LMKNRAGQNSTTPTPVATATGLFRHVFPSA
jgi:hypothetical protein